MQIPGKYCCWSYSWYIIINHHQISFPVICLKNILRQFFSRRDVINTSFFSLLIEISGKILLLHIWLLCDYWSASHNLPNYIKMTKLVKILICIPHWLIFVNFRHFGTFFQKSVGTIGFSIQKLLKISWNAKVGGNPLMDRFVGPTICVPAMLWSACYCVKPP